MGGREQWLKSLFSLPMLRLKFEWALLKLWWRIQAFSTDSDYEFSTQWAFKHKQLTNKSVKFDLGEVESESHCLFLLCRLHYYFRMTFFGFYQSSVILPFLLLIIIISSSSIVFQQRYHGAWPWFRGCNQGNDRSLANLISGLPPTQGGNGEKSGLKGIAFNHSPWLGDMQLGWASARNGGRGSCSSESKREG